MNDSRTPRSTASLANSRSVLTNSACAGGKSFSCVHAGKVRTNSKNMLAPNSFIGYLLVVFRALAPDCGCCALFQDTVDHSCATSLTIFYIMAVCKCVYGTASGTVRGARHFPVHAIAK